MQHMKFRYLGSRKRIRQPFYLPRIERFAKERLRAFNGVLAFKRKKEKLEHMSHLFSHLFKVVRFGAMLFHGLEPDRQRA